MTWPFIETLFGRQGLFMSLVWISNMMAVIGKSSDVNFYVKLRRLKAPLEHYLTSFNI